MEVRGTTTLDEQRVRRRAVVAAAAGNFVEWFDFAIYAVFATVIARLFFPSADPLAALLATFAVFGVSYVFRPIGAVVFGHVGDRRGRRDTLARVIVIMSLATFAIGLTPPYATVGVAAPLILVAARAVQGFSAGGEWGGAATFLAEYAPPGRRGLYCGFALFTTMLGILAGVLLGALLTVGLPAESLGSWGWRIPFLLALPLGLVGLYLRLRLDDTPRFRAIQERDALQRAPLGETLRSHRAELAAVVGATVLAASGAYLLLFLSSYSVQILKLGFLAALTANALAFAASAAAILATAALSDRVGRKPVLTWSAVAVLVITVPAFLLLQEGYASVLVAHLVLGAAIGAFTGPLSAAITELFPTRVRYSGLSLGFSLATSVFGGTTPLALTWLLQRTGDPLSPAYFFVAIAALSLVTVLLMRETAEDPLID